jgi:hypothetical protein
MTFIHDLTYNLLLLLFRPKGTNDNYPAAGEVNDAFFNRFLYFRKIIL